MQAPAAEEPDREREQDQQRPGQRDGPDEERHIDGGHVLNGEDQRKACERDDEDQVKMAHATSMSVSTSRVPLPTLYRWKPPDTPWSIKRPTMSTESAALPRTGSAASPSTFKVLVVRERSR